MTANGNIPASRIDMLYSSTGLRQYLEDQRNFEGAQYDLIHNGAAAYKQALMRYMQTQGKGGFAATGPGARVAIRQIIKPFERAADLHMEAQKNLALVWINTLRVFPPEPPKSSANTFNPNK